MKPVIPIIIAVGIATSIIVVMSVNEEYQKQKKFEDLTSSYMDKVVPTLEDFRNTLNESQDIETIFFKFGEPHRDIGSGIHIYVYELNDSTEIWIGYTDRILSVKHMDSDGNILEQLL
jgi:hypothetical protein